MHLHEYQAKRLFSTYGIPVPVGTMVDSSADAAGIASTLGGDAWVVKAQVHAGGRGKAGGVKRVTGRDELEATVDAMLGTRLITPQTGPAGLPVNSVLVEETVDLAREYYLGITVDRARERLVVMASAAGGMDIETVAARDPDAILTEAIIPAAGLQSYQCRNLAFGLGLKGRQVGAFTGLLSAAFRLAAGMRCQSA